MKLLKKSRVIIACGTFMASLLNNENNAEPDCGYRNNFFIMKSEGKWMFTMKVFHGFGHDYWEEYNPPAPRERFQYFQDYKIYGREKDLRVNEELFMKRYQNRNPLTVQKFSRKIHPQILNSVQLVICVFQQKRFILAEHQKGFRKRSLELF
jgi:hypothetical protein